MKLVQIFLPRYDNSGRPFPKGHYVRERERLTERFGGMTAYTQIGADGLWQSGKQVKRDQLVLFEVMVRRVDRKWWAAYRHRLQKQFRQKSLLVRAQDIKVL
jgi:hypothetical protein